MSRFGKFSRGGFLAIASFYLLTAGTAFAAKHHTSSGGQKTSIQGVVVSRDAEMVKVQAKSGTVQEVLITSGTKIERDGKLKNKTMGADALVPGLKVKVSGVTTGSGPIEAKKVLLKPDAYAITIAQQQAILANKAATERAQASADEGLGKADAAQTSADKAQNTANDGLSTAKSATAMANENAAAVQAVNQRVTDTGEYVALDDVTVNFPEGGYRLDKKSKAALDNFIVGHSNLNGSGYVIAITGHTSSTGTRQFNQTLSDRRAAAVAQYLREKGNVPSWRITTPAGYGETHPLAENNDPDGRARNRRVEVKILVSKALHEPAPLSAAAAVR